MAAPRPGPPHTRICSDCHEPHPTSHFPRGGPRCRRCRERFKNREYKRRTYTPATKRDLNLRVRYGITAEQYDRMRAKQQGVCAICFEEPSGRGLMVDHHHESGQVRQLLCYSCNTVLGMVAERPEHLKALIRYLRTWERRRPKIPHN